MVAAYNSNSVRARNLMTNVRRDDVLVQEMPCVARVRVDKAFFMPGYSDGGGGVPAPFMRMTGTVASLFIEDDDDRMFPCNDKEIQMMDNEQVMIDYLLSPDEVASLAMKGMFHDPLFKPPANLEGNTIEIPVNIMYRGVYETPVCFVEIVKPLELATSTKDNNYYGLFEACEPSPVVQLIKEDSYEYTQFNEPEPEAEPTFADYPKEAEEALEQERLERQQARSERIGLEDPEVVEQREDDDIFGKVDQEIAEMAAKAAEAKAADHSRVAADLLAAAKEDFRQEKAAKDAASANEFKMYGFGEEDKKDIARPDPETRASNIYEQLRARAEAMRQAQEEGGGGDPDADIGQDEQPQEEQAEQFFPFDVDIEGGEDGKNATPEQKAKAEAAKQQRINRQVDRAEDLKAMNMGITDTAGFGAAEAPAEGKQSPVQANAKAIAARSMLERLKQRQAEAASQASHVEGQPAQQPDPNQQYL